MKINLVTLCSGIEAQGQAMRRLCRDYPELEWELLAWSEIDKDAIKAHDAIFPEYADRNIGDMTTADYSKITEPVDCLFYSTPCQSVSVAGQNKGMEEGSDAASALIWHTRRAIETFKPKVCILENVKGMIMGKNVKEFHKWQNVMESYGYTNFAKVLNSKDYGIPQNRERLFMISILDCTKSYHFPEPFKLEKRIKDILEPYGTVDESFYFSPEQLLRIVANIDKTDSPDIQVFGKVNNSQDGIIVTDDSISPCHCAGHGNVPKILEPCILTPQRTEEAKELRRKGIEVFGHRELVPREDGVSNTITTVQKDNLLAEPCILGYTRDKKGKVVDYHDKDVANTVHTLTGGGWNTDQFVKEPIAVRMIGRNPDNPSDRSKGCPTKQTLEFGGGVSNCITTVQKDSMVAEPQISKDPRKAFDVLQFSDICPTLIATDYKSPKIVREPIGLSFANLPDRTVLKDEDGRGYLWQDGSLWRVRKLTGLEVMRLMDVADEDYYKMKDAGISKTAIYSLAGNSIVVAVLYHLFRKLWIDTENESAQKSLFDL